MAAPPLSNSFEGGTDTVAITTGNSGGASGNAFDAVVGTLSTFSATQARGVLSDQIIQGVTNADTSVGWNSLGSITTDLWGRQYLYLTANPNVAMNIGQVRTSAAAHSSSIFITTGGKVEAKNGAGSAIVASLGTVSVSLNTWVRIEWRIISSTTAGVVEWRLYNVADSTTISDTATVTAQVLGANSDQVRFGNPSAGPTSITTYHDDVAVSSTDWIGPTALPAQGFSVRPLMLMFKAGPLAALKGFLPLPQTEPVVAAVEVERPVQVYSQGVNRSSVI